MKRILIWILRLYLGGVTLAAGIAKSLELPGFASVLQTYRLHLSSSTLLALAVTVAIIEIGVGLWVLSGLAPKSAAVAGMVMNAGYLAIMTQALIRGLSLPNCGCFGVFMAQPLRWYSPLEDVVQIGLFGVLYAMGGRRLRGAR
ncbi:MAG TPA: MauE/DoxX family redox-associated membrane protein [Alphaproteobacteria bacterium]|nr:MauE/DoxX family redox-associated membrane protein [Alphaproteobacteria bacterium]